MCQAPVSTNPLTSSPTPLALNGIFVALQAKTEKSTRKMVPRSVQFSNTLYVREFPKHPDDVKNDIWYDKRAYTRIMEEFMPTLAIMMADSSSYILAGSDEEDDHCTRGLEDKTIKGLRKRSDRHDLVLDCVFEEQCIQWENGMYMPERIAAISRIVSKESRAAAYRTGLFDEAAVKGDKNKVWRA